MLEKRRKEIEEGVNLTEKMKTEEEKQVVRREKLMEEGRAEAHTLLVDAKVQSKEEEKIILAAAHKEAQEIIQKAKAEAEREHENLRVAIRSEATLLAGDMVRRMLAGGLNDEQQHKMIAKSMKEIVKSN